ncbi:hypothetical protein GGI1_03896 [Acidithiobacillus sp. GGI-221]|nr:hypothetical protein GGI1_03896 [Acidithiobacillus sp. GGI-221]
MRIIQDSLTAMSLEEIRDERARQEAIRKASVETIAMCEQLLQTASQSSRLGTV